MKKCSVVVSCICTLFLFSCVQVTFDQPQPSATNSLSVFPKRIQGKYISHNQDAVITISDELMTIVYELNEKTHKDSVGRGYQISGDTLIDVSSGNKQKIEIIGDTIIQHQNQTDTIFRFDSNHVLKRFKGYYFLNEQVQPNQWGITKIYFKNGKLIAGKISNETDIKQLREITESASDTISTNFHPTKRQFKKFVRNKGFSEEETYNRLRD